jgi:hypothetical protein
MYRSFSIDKMYFSIGQHKLLSLMLFTCGLFAVQRFTITPLNGVVCSFPFGLFLVQMLRGHHQTALTCLLIALFLSIDNGGGAYAETIAPLRYVIYMSAIGMLFYLSKWRMRRKPLLLATLLGCSIAFGSVTSALGTTPIDVATLQNNLIVLFILSAFLIERGSVKLELHLLFSSSFGYLVGEVMNALFFFKDFTNYLSYDSLKAFVVFPFIYTLLTRRNVIIKVVLAIMTLYIIFLYGTRMITLSFIALITAALVINLIRNRRAKSLLGFLIVLIVLANVNRIVSIADTDFMQFKSFAFLVQIQQALEASDISQILELLDPVRFAEHQLFFERPILQVIFGSGIGSGIYDANGVFAFVTFDQTAFSEQELSSSTFYNLHDFWIDYGLRFGLLPIAYLIYQIVLREMHNSRTWHGVLFGMLLLNTTFATSGILLTALLVRFLPRTLEK